MMENVPCDLCDTSLSYNIIAVWIAAFRSMINRGILEKVFSIGKILPYQPQIVLPKESCVEYNLTKISEQTIAVRPLYYLFYIFIPIRFRMSAFHPNEVSFSPIPLQQRLKVVPYF